MVTYIATVYAKPGHEDQVTAHYKNLEPLLASAKGFHTRKIYRAMPGTMAEEIRKRLPPEKLVGHPDGTDQGTHFIVIENWDSVEDRVAFALGAGRSKDLIEHLHNQHTHEFYEEV